MKRRNYRQPLEIFEEILTFMERKIFPIEMQSAPNDSEYLKKVDRLPEALQSIYRTYNGQDRLTTRLLIYNMRMMSIEEILSSVDGVRWWFSGAPSLAEEISRHSVPPNTVKETITHPYWWPFACDDAGGYIAVDMAPDEKGEIGQVIVFGSDQESNFCLTVSLPSFLEWYANQLKTGNYIKCHGHGLEYLQLRDSDTRSFVDALQDILLPLVKVDDNLL